MCANPQQTKGRMFSSLPIIMLRKIISGLLSVATVLSVMCFTAGMFALKANAAVEPVYEYTVSEMTKQSNTKNNVSVSRKGYSSSRYARFTVNGNDPYVQFSSFPSLADSDKYIAIEYKTGSSMTNGSFYFHGAEPPAYVVYNNNNQWNTAVIDASTAGSNWTGRTFIRFDPFNDANVITNNYIDVRYIAFFSSKAMAHAYNGTECVEGDITVEYVESSATLTVTASSDVASDKEIVIEEQYDNIPVTSISSGAFSNVAAGTVITIPDSVTDISSSAFSGVEGDVILKVNSGSAAHTYAIENGISYRTETSESDFIVETEGITSTIVGYKGTGGPVTIPTTYGNTSITTIADRAFKGNSTITSLTFSTNITSIGEEAFAECSALTTLELAQGLTTLGKSAFRGCSALTSATVPSSLSDLSDFTFLKCTSLSSVTVSEGVARIGLRAFDSCAMTSINLPSTLKTLGKYAFINCASLSKITFSTSNPYFSADNGALISKNSKKLIYVPEANTSYSLSSSITSIERAAYYNTSATEVTVPDTVTSISDKAFASSESLTKVTLSRAVTSIGYDTFTDSGSLTVYCYNRSTAHSYALENSVPYQIILEDGIIFCDVNGDGFINSFDVIELKIYFSDNGHFIYTDAADINSDGVIDTSDAKELAQILFDRDFSGT